MSKLVAGGVAWALNPGMGILLASNPEFLRFGGTNEFSWSPICSKSLREVLRLSWVRVAIGGDALLMLVDVS